MATTTPNYGWTVPTSTDLVKDGATAIETLGDAIDASMNTALGTKKAGMVLLNTTSFSGVSSFSLPANTFSATYENYKVLITLSGTSADSDFYIRLRAAGVDTSSNNYFYGNMAFRSNNTANNYGFASVSSISVGQGESAFASNANYYYDVDISQPQLAVNTKVLSKGVDADGSSNYVTRQTGGVLNLTTQYDSATFIISAGTMSGKYSVYGYNF